MHYLILIIFIFLGACKTLPSGDSKLRLTGGREVAKKDYPSVAAIVLEQPMTKRYRLHCTISRIGPYTFLTSARCIYNVNTKNTLPFFQQGSVMTIYYGKSFPQDTNISTGDDGLSETPSGAFLTGENSAHSALLPNGQAMTREQFDQINAVAREVNRNRIGNLGDFYLSRVKISEIFLTPSFLATHREDVGYAGDTPQGVFNSSDVAVFTVDPSFGKIPENALPYSRVVTNYELLKHNNKKGLVRAGGYSYESDSEIARLRYDQLTSVASKGYYYQYENLSDKTFQLRQQSKGAPVFRGDKDGTHQEIVGVNSFQNKSTIYMSQFNLDPMLQGDDLNDWFKKIVVEKNYSDEPGYSPYKATRQLKKLKCGDNMPELPVAINSRTREVISMPNEMAISFKTIESDKNHSVILYLDHAGLLEPAHWGGYNYRFQYLGYDTKNKSYLVGKLTYNNEKRRYNFTVKSYKKEEGFLYATSIFTSQSDPNAKAFISNRQGELSSVSIDSICNRIQ